MNPFDQMRAAVSPPQGGQRNYRLGYQESPETKLARERSNAVQQTLHGYEWAQANNFNQASFDRFVANTGHEIAEDEWFERKRAEFKLRAQTDYIVDTLLGVLDDTDGTFGADLRRPAHEARNFAVSASLDKCEEMQHVKNQIFLPIVAHTNRNGLIRDFEKWIETHRHTRYYVLTSGRRCSFGQIKKRFKWMHNQIAELRRKLAENGIPGEDVPEIVLRCDEITIKREPDGTLSFHVHSNLAIHFPRFISGGFREQWKLKIEEHFGTIVEDCGEIKNCRELVKYFCKYERDKKDVEQEWKDQLALDEGRIVAMKDLTPLELANLYAVRRGLKPVQTMGGFREWRKMLTEKRLKTTRKWDKATKTWRLKLEEKNAAEERDPARKADPKEKNVLLCITEPQPLFERWTEPILVVKNFDGNYDALRKKYGLEDLKTFVDHCRKSKRMEKARETLAAAAPKPDLGGPSLYELDTSTETPGEKAPPVAGWQPPDTIPCVGPPLVPNLTGL